MVTRCSLHGNVRHAFAYNLLNDVIRLHEEKGWKKINREFYVGNCTRPGLNMKQGKESTFVFVKK